MTRKIVCRILIWSFLGVICLSFSTSASILEEEKCLLDLYYNEKDLIVFSSKRHPQPLTEVAENMLVITAETIREMNARTLAGVLKRVPGFFMTFDQDLFGTMTYSAQGSEQRHLLVVVDGIPWNNLSAGIPHTSLIRAAMIERIEIIKGPASSAWGSALGGVINVTTKTARNSNFSGGTVQSEWGEHGSQFCSAQIAGKDDKLNYYLFAGRDTFNTPKFPDSKESESVYSKINVSPLPGVTWKTSVGYTKMETDTGDVPSSDIYGITDLSRFFATTALNAKIGSWVDLQASVYALRGDDEMDTWFLGLKRPENAGDVYKRLTEESEEVGGHLQGALTCGRHKAVLGIEMEKSALDRGTAMGPLLQANGLPAETHVHPDIEQRAVFFNDTIQWGACTISSGIRYDHNDITGGFVSPSLGLTRRMGENSLLRISVARGFTLPPLIAMSGGALTLDVNSELDSEEVWSYQAGLESTALRYLWLKGTVFYHGLDNALARISQAGGNDMVVNIGSEERRGIELESETTSFFNTALAASVSYVSIKNDPSIEKDEDDVWSGKIGVRYDDHDSFRAELFGHYFRWDYVIELDDEYETFIWDLNCSKKISRFKNTETELFLTVHNLFDGSEYNSDTGRWLEAGIRFNF